MFVNIKPLLVTLSLSNSLNLSVNLSCNLSVPKYVYCNLSFSHLFLYIYLFTVSLSFSYFFSLFLSLRPSHLFSLSIPLPSLCLPPSLSHTHAHLQIHLHIHFCHYSTYMFLISHVLRQYFTSSFNSNHNDLIRHITKSHACLYLLYSSLLINQSIFVCLPYFLSTYFFFFLTTPEQIHFCQLKQGLKNVVANWKIQGSTDRGWQKEKLLEELEE